MPFDGLSNVTLTDTARILGITPISAEFLQAYKAEQVRKNPGSWWYRHRDIAPFLVAFSLLVSVIAAVVGVCILAYSILLGTPLIVVSITAFIGIFGSGLLSTIHGPKVKGPAEWREVRLTETPTDIPPTIMDMARSILAMRRGSSLVVGELYQEEVMIDPYLLVLGGDECICLGIWDETGVLHTATVTR